MLTKESLISQAKSAKEIGANLYIINENNNIHVELFKGYSEDYTKYNRLITAMTPKAVLNDDYCIYKGCETTINKMVQRINEDYSA